MESVVPPSESECFAPLGLSRISAISYGSSMEFCSKSYSVVAGRPPQVHDLLVDTERFKRFYSHRMAFFMPGMRIPGFLSYFGQLGSSPLP
jgi:hypothetical protein